MAPLNIGFTPIPRDGSNGRGQHLPACDKCGRPFVDQAQAVEYEARAKQQQEAQQQQIASLLKQARTEERDASDARENAEIRRLNALIVQQNEAADDRIHQAVESGLAAERLAMTSAMVSHQAELDRLRRENGRMTRLLDERKPTVVGKIAEFDLTAALKAASPEDDIERIRSGAKGADVLQKIRHKGQLVSEILWESKDVATWQETYATKLAVDQVNAHAAFGVCVTTVLPSSMKDYGVHNNGVVLCSPAYVVATMRVLRYAALKMARAAAAGQAHGNVQAAVHALFAGEGEGRVLLDQASNVTPKVRDNERRLVHYVEQHASANEKLLRTQEQAFDKIFAALDEVMSGSSTNGDAA